MATKKKAIKKPVRKAGKKVKITPKRNVVTKKKTIKKKVTPKKAAPKKSSVVKAKPKALPKKKAAPKKVSKKKVVKKAVKKVVKKVAKKILKKKPVVRKVLVKKKTSSKKLEVTKPVPDAPAAVNPIIVEEVNEVFITPEGEFEVTETTISVDEESIDENGFPDDDLANSIDEEDEEELE
jgi:hypothetical protein